MAGMFGQRPQPPAVKPPPVMPDTESPDVKAAGRRAAADAIAAGGRSSTVLTTKDNRPLAAGGYGSKVVGG